MFHPQFLIFTLYLAWLSNFLVTLPLYSVFSPTNALSTSYGLMLPQPSHFFTHFICFFYPSFWILNSIIDAIVYLLSRYLILKFGYVARQRPEVGVTSAGAITTQMSPGQRPQGRFTRDITLRGPLVRRFFSQKKSYYADILTHSFPDVAARQITVCHKLCTYACNY